MTTDVEALAKRLGVQAEQIAAEGHFGWGNLDTEAADALRSQAELIGRLESLRDAHIVSIREHIHKQWAAEERAKALEAKCALLAASLAQAENEVENLKHDIDRYMRIVNEEVARGDALLGALQLLAEVYDAMGAPRGPARIKADAAIAAHAGSKEGA